MIQLQFVLIVYSANMTHLKSNMKPNNFWIVVDMFISLSFSNRSCSASRCLPLVFVGGMGGGCPVSGVCHCDLPRWSALSTQAAAIDTSKEVSSATTPWGALRPAGDQAVKKISSSGVDAA